MAEDGTVLIENPLVDTVGLVLQPGEYTYLCGLEYLEADQEVADCSISINERPVYDSKTTRFDSSMDFLRIVHTDNPSNTEYFLLVSVTNPTNETIYQLSAVGVLMDAEGTILDISSNFLYDIGLTPGSTVVFRFPIYDEALENVDLNAIKMDALAGIDKY